MDFNDVNPPGTSDGQPDHTRGVDPVWTSSRTARQIYALTEVEEGIRRLLSLAASSISLLTLPQTDDPDDNLPQGGERSELFVLEVSKYFEQLDRIHISIRSSLAHIRQSRISPSAINAPPLNFTPPSLGVGLPPEVGPLGSNESHGLQEERIERDAWIGVLGALTRLRELSQGPRLGQGGSPLSRR